MKFLPLLLSTALFSAVVVCADEPAPAWQRTDDFSLSQAVIGRIRVQAICNALVELKLQEIALQRGEGSEAGKLALVQAQQFALQQEIVHVTILTLEDDERRMSEKYLSEHPRMKAIRAEIELRKAELKSTS